jgi:hypothetical protein
MDTRAPFYEAKQPHASANEVLGGVQARMQSECDREHCRRTNAIDPSESMKIIFLDVDGVLITTDSFTRPDKPKGPAQGWPPCIEQLNRIVRETGARICISSVHRGVTQDHCLQCQDKLLAWGVVARFAGCTPNLRDASRGKEIQHVLDLWIKSRDTTVESFVILDDDSDMEHLAPALVQSAFERELYT